LYLDTLEKRRQFLISKRNDIINNSWRMWFCQRRLKRFDRLLEEIDLKIYLIESAEITKLINSYLAKGYTFPWKPWGYGLSTFSVHTTIQGTSPSEKEFIQTQQDLPPEFEKVLRDNFWDLLA